MFFAVINVTPLDNCQLLLKFENGKENIFDMKPYLHGGIFRELKDEAIFKTVKISLIEWANQANIDLETLYHAGVALPTNKSL